jgi:hypothetical protein
MDNNQHLYLGVQSMNPQSHDDEWSLIVASYEEGRQRAARFEVEPPGSPWIEGVDVNAIYPRQCYERAYEYAIHESRCLEKHHFVLGETSLALGGHAWVELPNGLVFDGVFQRFYRREDYYGEMAHATPWYIYDAIAAHRFGVTLKVSPGHWWSHVGLPMIWNRPPISINDQYATELIDKYYLTSGEAMLTTLPKYILLYLAKQQGIKVGQSVKKADLISLLMQSQKPKK